MVVRSLGASFTSFYRLVGPFRSRTAPEVVKTEIWDTIVRRGILGNIVMGLIPMVFYLSLNIAVYVVAATGEFFGACVRGGSSFRLILDLFV